MTLMIKNDWKTFSPERSDGVDNVLAFTAIVGGMLGIATTLVLPWYVGPVGLLPLLLCVLLPFYILMFEGNVGERLNSGTKVAVWNKYKSLPKELKSRVTGLTPELLAEMDESDADRLRIKMEKMETAYWNSQKALTAPVVQSILHNVEDATASYAASAEELRKMVEAGP